MSINPPSDIVLDVARASDPQQYRAAVERLQQMGGAKAASGSTVPEAFSVPAPPPAPSPALPPSQAAAKPPQTLTAPSSPSASAAVSKSPGDAKSAAAYQKFEAFLLQTFVEAMLPKDATNVYGSGTAGDIWRSMFAEHIADELATSAKLGIAERISEHRNRS
ncbi:MAG: rod-binding protein [Alphaproteobacteria bacterium]